MTTVIVVSILVLGALAVVFMTGRHERRTVAQQTRPVHELAQAVRIIDRMLTVDDVSPVIPAKLRQEAEAFLNTLNKESKPQ